MRLLAALCGLLLVAAVAAQVHVSLRPAWARTSLTMEASEFFADQSNGLFWDFVTTLGDVSQKTDKEIHDAIMAFGTKKLSSTKVDLLSFALSVNQYSPRVEMFRQIASTERVGRADACTTPAWLHIGGQFLCNPGKITAEIIESSLTLANEGHLAHPDIYNDRDHVFPGSNSSAPNAILYCQIGTHDCNSAHAILVPFARAHRVEYVLRHYDGHPAADHDHTRDGDFNVQGYGVEMAIKNTEYKVVDDRAVQTDKDTAQTTIPATEDTQGFLFGKLIERKPELKDQLLSLRTTMLSSAKDELEQVKAWQMKDLGFQAAQRILNSPDPLTSMRDLAQNFPMLAAPLSRVAVNSSVQNRVRNGRNFMEPGNNVVLLNGRVIDTQTTDPFSLIEIMTTEAQVVEQLRAMQLPGDLVERMAGMSLQADSSAIYVDARSPFVTFLNDLSKDAMYKTWPKSINELLAPGYPGQLKFIGANIFTTVFYVDPTSGTGMNMIATMFNFQRRQAPLRFGAVLAPPKKGPDAKFGSSILRSFLYIKDKIGAFAAINYIVQANAARGQNPPNHDHYHQAYDAIMKNYPVKKAFDEAFQKGDVYEDPYNDYMAYVSGTGLPIPCMLLNGQVLEGTQYLDQVLLGAVHPQQNELVMALHSKKIDDKTDIYDYFMKKDGVLTRYSSTIIPSAKTPLHIVPLPRTKSAYTAPKEVSAAEFTSLPISERLEVVLSRMWWYQCTHPDDEVPSAVSHLLIADLGSSAGIEQLRNAIDFLHSLQCTSTRLTVLHNPSDEPAKASPRPAEREQYDPFSPALALLAGDPHNSDRISAQAYVTALLSGLHDMAEYAPRINGGIGRAVATAAGAAGQLVNEERMSDATFRKAGLQQIVEERAVSNDYFGVAPGEMALVTNGRIIKITTDALLVEEDFKLLENYELTERAKKVSDLINAVKFDASKEEQTFDFFSDRIMTAVSLMAADDRRSVRRMSMDHMQVNSNYAAFEVGAQSTSPFKFVAIIDPISAVAQRFTPVLMAMHDAFNARIQVFLNPPHELGALPLQKFYRYALDSSVSFKSDGSRRGSAPLVFNGLPLSATLTAGIDAPEAWMVDCIKAPYDMDNIVLNKVKAGDIVEAVYLLEHILVEGNCYDAQTGQPPSGLGLIVGTRPQPHVQDTVVMANLGYFQLKASPGVWDLQIKPGRAAILYGIVNADNHHVIIDKLPAVVDGFNGRTIPLHVRRQPGREHDVLLSDDPIEGHDGATSGGGSLWSAFGSVWRNMDSTNETIHIFSVASGHLYERFLRIMFLTVKQNTKNPVKFWVIKNFLSPKFKDFIPYMAKEYGFEVEMVSYKWPRWLNHQTEKQRFIWGMKILFLDVLFPLNIKKVIFVDADQTVRGDMAELFHMDLQGAPYGFTPFCDSRSETEGFRFWKQGYWANHLNGKPYHISALYVVDLQRFRLMSAGDTLRGTYQGLSQDPNSLANLDQDLPNHLQHQVPIFSLPQEWLWCETWCDDASLSTAKTIDLCNNPLTKIPKLENAKRILKEWPSNDAEITALEERFYSERTAAPATHQ